MKKILYIILLLALSLFGNFDPNICNTEYMSDSIYEAKPKKNCVIDDNLERWIKCRAYFEKNMLNGLGYHGKNEVQGGPTFMYDFFDKEIKKVLLEEVKKVIDRSHNIMCVKNTEDDLFEYQMSIAEHEWCYAPKFLEAFNDEFMNEHEMKYEYFAKLYNVRSTMLENKERPKDKSILCGVYLECMNSFINANHTQVSSGLSAIYEKTQKECASNYFTIRTSIEYKENTRKMLADKSFLSHYNLSRFSKQVMHIDPKRGIIETIGIKVDAKNRYEGQRDIFDMKSCSVVHKRDKTKIDDNVNDSLTDIEAHNIFNSNSKNVFIKISVDNEQFRKSFKVPWSALKDGGSWSGNDSKSKSHSDSGELPATGEEESAKIIANTKIYKQLKDIMKLERAMLPEMRANGRKGADLLGLVGEDRCKNIYFADMLLGYTNINTTYNSKIKVNISPASKFDIDMYKLHKEDGQLSRVYAREIVPSKFEKEPTSMLDVLQNSMYDKISDKDKKAWDRADKEHKKAVQNKKDVEEFDSISIDDLEMFSK